MFTGVQPLLELESCENLEEPPRGETDAMDLTVGGWGFRETRHLSGLLCTDPECPGGLTSAPHSSHPVASTRRPASPGVRLLRRQLCLGPGLGNLKAGLGSGGARGLAETLGRVPAQRL